MYIDRDRLPIWLSICLAIAALALSFLCVSIGVAALQMRQATIELEDPHTGLLATLTSTGASIQLALTQELDRSVDKLVAIANTQGDKARDAAVEAIDGAKGDVIAQVVGIRGDLAAQLAKTNGDVGTAVAAVTRLSDTTSKLTVDLDSGVKQLNDTAPLFLNCDHNPDCLFNRYVGVSKSVEQASQTVAIHLPILAAALDAQSSHTTSITANVAEITKDAAIITDKIVAPVPWWRKALSVLRDVSIFARLLE